MVERCKENLWKENDKETILENISVNKKYIEDLKKIKILKLSKSKFESVNEDDKLKVKVINPWNKMN